MLRVWLPVRRRGYVVGQGHIVGEVQNTYLERQASKTPVWLVESTEANMSRGPGRGLPPIPPQEESPYAELIHADILLPTGMMLTLNCHKTTTLAEMKNNIWQEARSYPLFDHMKHQGFYSFIGV